MSASVNLQILKNDTVVGEGIYFPDTDTIMYTFFKDHRMETTTLGSGKLNGYKIELESGKSLKSSKPSK